MKSRVLKSLLLAKSKSPLARIIVLTGARQTGKTTLARLAFPAYSYLSIEDPILRLDYKNLTAAQWAKLYPQAILDEIQKEPVLVESVKSVYDQYPKPRYLLLGSSQLLLLKKVKESLAGRCIIVDVYPLTIPEIRTTAWDDLPAKSLLQKLIALDEPIEEIRPFKLWDDYTDRIRAYDYYLNFGGYPALVDENISDDDRFEWLRTYIRTYLERDVRDLAEFKSLEPFVKIQKITALLTGQQMNYSLLGKEASISSKTAKRYLEYLSLSYQIVFLKPWYRNKLKRLSKTPKLHYLDPGIQRAIVGKRGDLTGHEFESAIVPEIIKQLKTAGFIGEFYHIRSHDGFEIDLLIETEQGYFPIEIKQSVHINKSDVRHLVSVKEILDKPVLKSFIISNDKRIQTFNESIYAIPAALFLT